MGVGRGSCESGRRNVPARGIPPAPLLSLFVDDCIERGRGYHDRGARYSVRAPHAGGMPDTANSLYMLKRAVFDEERFSLHEFLEILRNNWEDQELLRRRLREEFALYGNDEDEADAVLKRVFDDYVELCAGNPERNGVLMPAGISTFGREAQFNKHRAATPFGTFAHDILASNLSPTPGTDRHGPTAVVKSFCKQDFVRLSCGTPLDLKIHPSCLQSENGLQALVALLKTFVAGGGLYLQVDAIDAQVLRDAQERDLESFPESPLSPGGVFSGAVGGSVRFSLPGGMGHARGDGRTDRREPLALGHGHAVPEPVLHVPPVARLD